MYRPPNHPGATVRVLIRTYAYDPNFDIYPGYSEEHRIETAQFCATLTLDQQSVAGGNLSLFQLPRLVEEQLELRGQYGISIIPNPA